MAKTPSASGLRLYALQRYANSSTAASYVLFTIAFASSSVNCAMPSDDVLNYASFLVLNSAVVPSENTTDAVVMSYSFSLIIAFIFDSFLLLFCALNSNLAFQRARCATGSIAKSSSTSVAVTVPALIFVFRKALSIIGVYFLDEWNGISTVHGASSVEITYGSNKITINNNATAAVDYLLLSQNK